MSYIENNVCAQVRNSFSAHKRVILVFISQVVKLREINTKITLKWMQKQFRNEGNKHQNNTQVSAETVRHESTYIILFHARHYESINDDKNDVLFTSSPCLTRSVFILLMKQYWLFINYIKCNTLEWTISQEMLINLMPNMWSGITLLKLLTHLSGNNKLMFLVYTLKSL